MHEMVFERLAALPPGQLISLAAQAGVGLALNQEGGLVATNLRTASTGADVQLPLMWWLTQPPLCEKIRRALRETPARLPAYAVYLPAAKVLYPSDASPVVVHTAATLTDLEAALTVAMTPGGVLVPFTYDL